MDEDDDEAVEGGPGEARELDAPLPEQPEAPRPQTRDEVREARARYANNLTLAHAFYGDLGLRADLQILFLGARPMMESYQDTLDVHKKGQALPP